MTYAQSWLELEKGMGGRTALKGTPAEIKAQAQQLGEMLASLVPPPNDAVATQDGETEGVKYRIYTPKEASKAGPLPVGVYTHGGGYMIGDINQDDPMCRILAEHAPCILISVEYSLTPEHKWPTQLNESLKVFKWAHQNAASYGGDANKLFTIGGSAGGALALQVANRLVKNPDLKAGVKGVCAIVPISLHYDNVPESLKNKYKAYTENGGDAAVIDKSSMAIFFEHLGIKPDDPEMFTALETANHKNFPPTYVCVCEKDPLRDDGYIIEELLRNAGVPTKLDEYPGLPHFFWIFPQIPEGQQFIANTIGGMKWLISQM